MIDAVAVGAVRFAVWLISLAPLNLVRWIGRGVGRAIWWSGGATAKVTLENIGRTFPDQPREVQRALAKESLQHTGQLGLESGLLWHWNDSRWRALIQEESGADLISEALASERGVLVLVPHFGNWEFFALYLGRYGYTCLYDPPRLKGLEAPMVRARERTGGRLLPIGRRGLRELTRTISGGGVGVLLPDQVPDPKSGVNAPFFGHEALTMTLVQKLVRRSNPVVLIAAIQRVSGGFSIQVTQAAETLGDEDERRAATALNAEVEAVVARDPAQYQWEYKRFKQPRAGKPTTF